MRKEQKQSLEKQSSQVYLDPKWVEERARSNISLEEFEDFLENLEGEGKLKGNELLDLLKRFKNLRKQLEEEKQKAPQKYDQNWVEKQAI